MPVADPGLEAIRRHIGAPVAPSEVFARSLLARLERELAGAALTAEEIDAQVAEELPLREAMSVIRPDPLRPVDPGAVLGEVESGTQPDQST
jgi:hypothetical protein